jgi:hypothetical protein
VTPPDDCEYDFVLLDELRYASFAESSKRDQLGDFLAGFAEDLLSPGFSSKPFAAAMIEVAQFWRSPSAKLKVVSVKKTGLEVYIDGVMVGLTNCQFRLKPSSFTLEIRSAGKSIYRKHVTLQKDEDRLIEQQVP